MPVFALKTKDPKYLDFFKEKPNHSKAIKAALDIAIQHEAQQKAEQEKKVDLQKKPKVTILA